MKHLIRLEFIFILFVLISCKKEEQIQSNVIPKSSPVTLAIDKVVNDSTLILKWNKANVKGFKSYSLSRSAKVFKNGTFTYVNEALVSTTNADAVNYTDNTMPFAVDITYSLGVITDSVKNNKYSTLSYRRKSAYLTARFSDMLVDKEKKRIFLVDMETGKIQVFNYLTEKLISSASLNIKVGFSALGSFGGANNELYVPTSDGWLFILDSETLTTKDRIYVGGYAIGSVIAVNDKLVISSSDRAYGTIYNNAIKIYDRGSKQVTGRTGNWDYTRLLLLENTNNEFIDITFNLIPVDLGFYQIDKNGIPIVKKSDNYHGDYPLDGNLVRSFPDGNRFITAGSGTVYRKDLTYEKSLYSPYSQRYTDFAFNSSGSVIYAAYKTEKKIDFVNYPSAVVDKTITTRLFPALIFRDGNKLVCITAESTNFKNTETIIFIEKFDI